MVIASDDGAVVGFAELFSDGELQRPWRIRPSQTLPWPRDGTSFGCRGLRLAGGERIDS